MTVTRKPDTANSPKDPVELAALAIWYEANSTATDNDPDWVEVEPVADPTVVRSVRLHRSTVERLAAAAEARGVGPTELMRSWIEERLDTEDAPSTEQAKLTLVRGLAEALIRESGIPGLSLEIHTSPAKRAARKDAHRTTSVVRQAAPRKVPSGSKTIPASKPSKTPARAVVTPPPRATSATPAHKSAAKRNSR